MKLELKHLAPYLPYGLKYIDDKGKTQKLRSLSGELKLIDLGWGDAQSYNDVKLALKPLSDLNKENADFLTGDGYMMVCEDSLQLFNIKSNINYSDFSKLLERHFDVFGLIEKGLAIDINTIDK